MQIDTVFIVPFLASSDHETFVKHMVVRRTTDRDSTRCRNSGIRRVRQLALGCGSI